MQSSIRNALYVATLLKGSNYSYLTVAIALIMFCNNKLKATQCIQNTAVILEYYDLCISTFIEGKLFTEGDLLDCQVVLFDFVVFCVFCD